MGLQAVQLNTRVPVYPPKAWSRIPADVKMEDLWQLCGPQVEKHLDRLPLWKVFCAVYYEGVMHGAGAALNLASKDQE